MGRFEFYGQGLPAIKPGDLKGKLVVIEGTDGVGRSTHIALLKEWLEHTGHAVLDTGMTRSALAGKGLKVAKEGHTLGATTMSLFYATDFADRLENEMIPALRAGFIVLTDRYTFSLMARAIVRGADHQWVKRVYEFALKPDLVVYLRTTVDELVTRVVQTAGFNYWESGMDLHLGTDMFDCFVAYQGRLLGVFDTMAAEYGFEVIDTADTIHTVSEQIKALVAPRLVAARQRAVSRDEWAGGPRNASRAGRRSAANGAR